MNFSRLARPYHWLTHHRLWQDNAREVAKQLPPSGAQLKLLDIGCGPGQTLHDLLELRPDIFPIGLDSASGMIRLARADAHYLLAQGGKIPLAANSIDAVFAQRLYYFLPADQQDRLLAEVLRVLRPGGRFIMVNPSAHQSPRQAWRELKYGVKPALDVFAWHLVAQRIGGFTPESIALRLQKAGFARILAEPVLHGWGMLSRGEKPHAENTKNAVSAKTGKFIHVLIQQTPNKPVWALQPDDVIEWRAAAIPSEGQPTVLAFTSLPRAVTFMQAAVMNNTLQGINKVAKFSRDFPLPILLNPTLEQIQSVVFLSIDPTTAEAPDE